MHGLLVSKAVSWLRKLNCRVILADPFRAVTSTGEQPDVLGFRDGHSILIECKVSRSDFLADKKKPFRVYPEMGMGDARMYFCPHGVISLEEVPKGWGLMWLEGERVSVIGDYPLKTGEKRYKWRPLPFEPNLFAERNYLVSASAKGENLSKPKKSTNFE